jgi:hypothetical protein
MRRVKDAIDEYNRLPPSIIFRGQCRKKLQQLIKRGDFV